MSNRQNRMCVRDTITLIAGPSQLDSPSCFVQSPLSFCHVVIKHREHGADKSDNSGDTSRISIGTIFIILKYL